MAVTSKGKAWEWKNTLFMFLSLVPLIGFLPLVKIGKTVHSKRCLIAGYVLLGLIVVSQAALFLLPALNNPYAPDYRAACAAQPLEDDYITYSEYTEKYDTSTQRYLETPEYQQYRKDYNAYWAQEEYAKLSMQYTQYNNTIRSLLEFVRVASVIIYVVNIVLVFSERSNYLKKLARMENQDRVMDAFAAAPPKEKRIDAVIPSEQARRAPVAPAKSELRLDINTATEEELAALQGLTIIDAKKAVTYRTQNGGFQSTDEFFHVIGAKPHIIAHLEASVFAGAVKAKEPSPVHRHIDF